MKLQRIILSGLITLLSFSQAQAGIIIGGTRVIYDGGQAESIITVKNLDKTPWIIQSWIDGNGVRDSEHERSKPPFSIASSLFRLNGEENRAIHITENGGKQPQNTESIYWLNIKSFPEHGSDKGNILTVSVNQRIKLIYRPKDIRSPTPSDYHTVTFSRKDKQLIVTNPTPYWLTFYSLKLGNESLKTENVMVPPAGTATYSVEKATSEQQISWQLINDYGGHTETIVSNFN